MSPRSDVISDIIIMMHTYCPGAFFVVSVTGC